MASGAEEGGLSLGGVASLLASSLQQAAVDKGAVDGAAVARALEAWRALGLSELQQRLDRHEMAADEVNAVSAASRKRLAQETKDWRKLPEGEGKAARLGQLMKLYQEEIDSLTKARRAADDVFLDVFKRLHGVPDPAPALAAATARAEALLADNARLTDELAANEREFETLSNQDVAVRDLEAKLAAAGRELASARAAADEQRRAAAAAREGEVSALVGERVRAIEGEAAELRAALAEQHALGERLREQLDEARAALDEREAAMASEAEMLAEDVGRANAEAAALRARLAAVGAGAQEVGGAAAGAGAGAGAATAARAVSPTRAAVLATPDSRGGESGLAEQDRARLLELEDQLIRKHESEQALRAQLSRFQLELEATLSRHAAEIAAQEARVKEASEELFATRVQLSGRPTHETVTRLRGQLQLLHALELGAGTTSGAPGDAADALDDSDTLGGLDPESLALVRAKVRRLDAAAAGLRVELEAAKHELENERRGRLDAEERFKDAVQEASRLGGAALRGGSSNQLEAAAGETGTAAAFLSAATAGLVLKAGPLAPLRPQQQQQQQQLLQLQLQHPHQQQETHESLLAIVHEQRNEFRKRMLELESERDSLRQRSRELGDEAESLRQDNVALYEKIKYLQTYCGGPDAPLAAGLGAAGAARSAAAASAAPAPALAMALAGGPSLPGRGGPRRGSKEEAGEVRVAIADARASQASLDRKYRPLYEERVNPFADFSARERRKRLKGLNAAERITLAASDFFLRNQYTRLFLFFYVVALHLLVFAAMLFSSHSSCNTLPRTHDPHEFSPKHAALHHDGPAL